MATSGKARSRQRGTIETLPSGSLRVKVYAGYDPLTGRRHYLSEVVPAGPRAAAEAERARTRLQHQDDEQRNPKTRATVNQLLDAYLEVLDVEPTTRVRYEKDIRLHIRPALGKLSLSRVTPEVLDRFYAQLRACRERCDGKGHTRHRTPKAHACDEQCCPKECKPLSASSVRAVHWVISAAFDKAVRWRWTGQNPANDSEPPSPPGSNPSPPSPAEAARLLTESWKDDDWGTLIWTAMVTGARRGELCALWREDSTMSDIPAAYLAVPSRSPPRRAPKFLSSGAERPFWRGASRSSIFMWSSAAMVFRWEPSVGGGARGQHLAAAPGGTRP